MWGGALCIFKTRKGMWFISDWIKFSFICPWHFMLIPGSIKQSNTLKHSTAQIYQSELPMKTISFETLALESFLKIQINNKIPFKPIHSSYFCRLVFHSIPKKHKDIKLTQWGVQKEAGKGRRASARRSQWTRRDSIWEVPVAHSPVCCSLGCFFQLATPVCTTVQEATRS